MATAAISDRRQIPWQVWFLVLGTIWGCSFWFIKLGLEMLSPVQVAFGRTALGAAALLIACVATRTALPRDRTTWKHLFVMGMLFNSVPFALFALGEVHISSVLAGIINSVTPLAVFVAFFVVFPQERATVDRLFGLLVGFVGVVIVLGVWESVGSSEWIGIGACMLAVCCYGVAFPYVRRHMMSTADTPLAICTGQVLAGTLQLLPFVLLSGGLHGSPTPSAVAGMLALGILGSGIAYLLNFQIIEAAGGTTASTVTYVTPVVAVIVGIAFLGEHLHWYEPVGAAVILLGAAITQGRLDLRKIGANVRRTRAIPESPG